MATPPEKNVNPASRIIPNPTRKNFNPTPQKIANPSRKMSPLPKKFNPPEIIITPPEISQPSPPPKISQPPPPKISQLPPPENFSNPPPRKFLKPPPPKISHPPPKISQPPPKISQPRLKNINPKNMLRCNPPPPPNIPFSFFFLSLFLHFSKKNLKISLNYAFDSGVTLTPLIVVNKY